MSSDPRPDSQPLPVGFDPVQPFARLNRDVVRLWVELWVGISDQAVRRGVERREIAIGNVRDAFGASAVPSAAGVWNWWAGTVAGLPGAYLEALHTGIMPAPLVMGAPAEPPIEVDLTETVVVDVTTRSTPGRATRSTGAREARPARERRAGGPTA
jgi:hypothetical protein